MNFLHTGLSQANHDGVPTRSCLLRLYVHCSAPCWFGRPLQGSSALWSLWWVCLTSRSRGQSTSGDEGSHAFLIGLSVVAHWRFVSEPANILRIFRTLVVWKDVLPCIVTYLQALYW